MIPPAVPAGASAVPAERGSGRDAVTFNPLLPEYRQDPHPFLHRLRGADPVHHSRILNVWVLTRYADVQGALKDERFSASARHWENYRRYFFREAAGGRSPTADAYGDWMLQLDPPDHTRLRALVNRAFTPRVAESLAQRVQRAIDSLLEPVLPQGEIDVIADLGYPLPIIVISDLLGVPQADHDKIKQWSRDLLPTFSPALSAAAAKAAGEAAEAFGDYFGDLVRKRRQEPCEDLISGLIAAREQEDRLSEAELLSMCMLLVFAGHASTVQLIGGAILALLEHPTQLELLRAEPALVGGAVEEALRYVSPLQLIYRTTTRPVEVGDRTIPANQMVLLSLAAANRDPEQFPDPDAFDIRRAPNRHIGFGYGIHYCAGAPLARLEGRLALDTVIQRCTDLSLAAPPQRESSLLLRGLTSLRVRFG